MKDHFGLSDKEYKKLMDSGFTISDFFQNMPLFDPDNTKEPIGLLGLYFYADRKGDFNSPPINLKHKRLARALFNSLSITMAEKLQLLSYLEDADNNFEDEE